jgi:3-oxoadipate enol-lactonase
VTESLASRPGRPGWSRAVIPAAVAIAAVGLSAAAAASFDVAGSLKVLAHVHWSWLAAGVALEVISVAAFAAMFRQLLKAGRVRPRRSEMLVTVYAANAMSVSVPLAGPGLATAYLFRRFTRSGATAAGAGWTLVAGGVISTTAWAVILAAGGLASGHTVGLAITIPVLTLAVAAVAAIAVATRYPSVRQVVENLLTRVLTRAARLSRWPATDPKLALRAWGQQLSAFRLPVSGWGVALGDSLLNWLTDVAVLTVAIIAVGARVPWHVLLLVYAAGVGAQGLSLTPGGLAITEGAISLALVASGLDGRQAVAAAVLYRLISFWFNAALGWGILLFLQARRPAAQSAREPVLEPPAEPAPQIKTQTAPREHQLVLLHGQPGSAADWDAVLARLPAHLHAVAKDRPGYGASQRNAAGFTANAQAVLDDLDERDVDAAVLVAHSWAGGAALLAARLAPHRVKAVVLLAGVGPGSVSIADWLLAAPVIGPLAAQVAWAWTPWVARVRLAWLSDREGRPLDPGEHLHLQVWGEKHTGAEPRWRAFLTEQRALLSELAELESALPSIGVPVLLLTDPADQIVPIMTAQRLVSELPDARLQLISDAGHHLPRRAPGAVAEVIAGFVAALDEPAASDSDGHVTAPGQVNSGTTRSACINGLRPRLPLLCKSAIRVRFPVRVRRSGAYRLAVRVCREPRLPQPGGSIPRAFR